MLAVPTFTTDLALKLVGRQRMQICLLSWS